MTVTVKMKIGDHEKSLEFDMRDHFGAEVDPCRFARHIRDRRGGHYHRCGITDEMSDVEVCLAWLKAEIEFATSVIASL